MVTSVHPKVLLQQLINITNTSNIVVKLLMFLYNFKNSKFSYSCFIKKDTKYILIAKEKNILVKKSPYKHQFIPLR